MARESLRSFAMASVLLASSGCVAPEPVDFQEPQQTPPFLDLASANPPLTRLLNLTTTDIRNFTVKLRSEDRGEIVMAPLWIDFDLVDGQWTGGFDFAPASTLADTSRSLSVSTVPNRKGCHQFTLFATHQSNFDERNSKPKQLKTDTAIAVWWALIDVDETADGGTNFGPCPDPALLGGDAGT